MNRNGKTVRWLVMSMLSAVLFLSLASCQNFLDSGDSFSIAAIEAQTFRLVNDYRLSIGRSALAWSDIIAAEERIHSQNMATNQVPIGHDGFYERIDRINQVIPWSMIAENVAFAGCADDAVAAWMKSPDHLEIIEGDYDIAGIGVAKSTSGSFYYFSQMFLKPR